MKLEFSVPDKVYYISNFLDYNTYKKIHYAAFNHGVLNDTKGDWNEILLKGYKASPSKFSLDDFAYVDKIKILLTANPWHPIPRDLNFKFVFHCMRDQSGINWHEDGGYKYGCTYYINKRWNRDFGGELMFNIPGNVNGFLPVWGNSMLILKSPVDHKVVPVMSPTVPRMTIQTFID